MEDAVIHELDIGDGNALFAVFDGHGGRIWSSLGSEVSQYVAKIFVDLLKGCQQYKNKDYKGALDQTFKKVDEVLKSEEGAKNLYAIRFTPNGGQGNYNDAKIANGSGCTANVLLITPDKYYVANIGDSRSSLSRAGKALDLSEDHKPENPI